jgi:acetylornithine deacetylase/succinyl-diaminopimelate desuccinylase family protein
MTDAAALQRIHAYLSAHRQDAEAFLAELVRQPTDNPPGDCAGIGVRAAALLEAMGFTVERHVVPEDEVHTNGMISAINIVVRHRFGDGPTIALNAHGDVVPPGGGWTRDPYGAEIVDGAMYGRGVAVSKSDYATYTFALRALMSAGVPLKGTIELHFTCDEEAGGNIGPKWLIDRGISKPDYAIAASFAYGIVTAHNGCLHLEVEVTGKQAHAALPATGVDALEAATTVLDALYRHRKAYASRHSRTPGIDTPTLVVGLIKGGINTNVVPDRVTLRLDRRIIPEEQGEAVEQELRHVVQEAMKAHPQARCTIRRILLAVPFTELPGAETLIEPLQRHGSRIMGVPIGTKGVPLYTDARHYTEAGIPTVLYGAGPRTILDANAHGADEHLVLDDLHKATEVVADALLDILSKGE